MAGAAACFHMNYDPVSSFAQKTKTQIHKDSRHFAHINNVPSTQETISFPLNQYPHPDHDRERVHYPHLWNGETTQGYQKPLSKHTHWPRKEPRPQCVKHVRRPQSEKQYKAPESRHFDNHLQPSNSETSYIFDRKIYQSTAGDRYERGTEYSLENSIGSHKRVRTVEERRNGIPVKNPGDLYFSEVIKSDQFWLNGSTLAHSDFGKIKFDRQVQQIQRGRKLDPNRSTRSDDWGRHSMRSRTAPAAPEVPWKVVRDKTRAYKEVAAENAKNFDIYCVESLPDTVLFGDQADQAEEDRDRLVQDKSRSSSKKSARPPDKSARAPDTSKSAKAKKK